MTSSGEKQYKICVMTGTRAEYGLLKNVISLLAKDAETDFRLLVTGSRLSHDFGYTIREIEDDGFCPDAKIECIVPLDNDKGMALSLAKAVSGFSEYFDERRPDMLVVLGDRYESFAAATVAALFKIPIAHLYGGDTTEGAVDEFFRHSITKMSYLHFVSNEDSRRRVIQLGENPDRVFNVGATGAENIKNMTLLDQRRLSEALGVDLKEQSYAVVTFHPVTMEQSSAREQIGELFTALDHYKTMQFIFTKANADGNGKIINEAIEGYAKTRENCYVFDSLGSLKYLSALKYAKMVIGNSSSGIYEAPLFGIPTINIGDRQRGRLQGETIINCKEDEKSIIAAIEQGLKFQKKTGLMCPYFKEGTSENIVREIKKALSAGKIDLKKKFYDIQYEE